MTLFILAHPEEEWKRLEKVVMAMPINADGDLVDGKPERLPKQIVSYKPIGLPWNFTSPVRHR
jgi:hypothetical protein